MIRSSGLVSTPWRISCSSSGAQLVKDRVLLVRSKQASAMKAQFIGADVALTPLSRWADWVDGVCRDIRRSRVAQDWLALGLKKWGRARKRDRVFIGLNVHKA